MSSQLEEFMKTVFDGKEPDDQKDSHFMMPGLKQLREVLSKEQDYSWLEKALQECQQHSNPETEQEKQIRALLLIVRWFGGVIPFSNGKATVSFDVPSELLNDMVAKGYLEESPEGYKVTVSGATLADR